MAGKFDVIVAGSCNYDIFCYTSRLPLPGETVHGKRIIDAGYGGKGANQAAQCSKLGAKVAMVGMVGDDHCGATILKNFDQFGINRECISINKSVPTGQANVIVADNGENSVIVIPGANFEMTISDVHKAESFIEQSKILIAQLETPVDVVLEALKIAKKHGLTTILNPAPAIANLNKEIYKFVDVLCPNETEAMVLTNQNLNSSQDFDRIMETLLNFGVQTVILTLGSKGCCFATQKDKRPVYVEAEKVKAVDSTGAGDSFVGAFAYFLTNFPSLPLADLVKRAVFVATKSVLKFGVHSSYITHCDLPSDWNSRY